jgi:predicted DCC family thiol-disulfide oxidoreductase YuxK
MEAHAARLVHVIYDGGCGFCVRSLRLVRRLDVRRALRFHDAADRERVTAEFPGLSTAELDEAMYAVDGRGETFRGFFAFRRLLWVSPLLWPLLPLFYCPGARVYGPRVYAWVARNRSRLGCRSDGCTLPPPPEEPRGERG